MTELSGWENFFVIMGSSAGALIGLQFVVITLVAAMPRKSGQEQAVGAYATRTIVHFGTVLLLSPVRSALRRLRNAGRSGLAGSRSRA